MDTYDISYANQHLEELIARTARGEDVRISHPKHGTITLTATVTSTLTCSASGAVDRSGRQHEGAATGRVTDTMEPFVPLTHKRIAGQLTGKMQVPARLMEPMSEEELKDWYGDDT